MGWALGGMAIPFVFVGGFLVLAAIMVIFGLKQAKKRREALQAFAQERGWQYDENGSILRDQFELPRFQLTKRAGERAIRAGVVGQSAGLDVAIADYVYSTGSGKNRRTVSQTFCLIGLPGDEGRQTLPDFLLANEHFFHRFADLFGYTDIDFDHHPKFSKQYRLTGNDENAIRDLFSSSVIEWFEHNVDKERTVEASGRWVMVYRAGKRRKIEQWPGLVDENLEVLQTLVG